MHLKRKYWMILGMVVMILLAVSITFAVADQPDAPPSERYGTLQQHDGQALVQIGHHVITSNDLANFHHKTKNDSSTILPDDAIVLKNMASKELLLQLAEENGVNASLEDGAQKAAEYRKLLESQPQEQQDIHTKLIAESGYTEADYWEQLAPTVYQDLLSVERLLNKLEAEQRANQADIILTGNKLREDLLETAIAERNVIVLDPTIQW
ncbi:hypothetical protein [Peribacillus sp. NPDC056705]|uniref:hypothetical protein n=1 Tax=Peribacillus sp. NPDC056705 TaxID=3345918 RepID=UPI003748AD12